MIVWNTSRIDSSWSPLSTKKLMLKYDRQTWVALPLFGHILQVLTTKLLLIRIRVLCLQDGRFVLRRHFPEDATSVLPQGSRLRRGCYPFWWSIKDEIKWAHRYPSDGGSRLKKGQECHFMWETKEAFLLQIFLDISSITNMRFPVDKVQCCCSVDWML